MSGCFLLVFINSVCKIPRKESQKLWPLWIRVTKEKKKERKTVKKEREKANEFIATDWYSAGPSAADTCLAFKNISKSQNKNDQRKNVDDNTIITTYLLWSERYGAHHAGGWVGVVEIDRRSWLLPNFLRYPRTFPFNTWVSWRTSLWN